MKPEADILIVEDSPTQALLLKHLLGPYGYPVTIARNGEEALARIRERRPALVISDFVMPGMNGRDLCQQIRQDPALRDIPFVLVTAQSDPVEGLEPAGQGGADACMTKPLSREQLDPALKVLLRREEPSPASAPPAGAPKSAADLPVFDGRQLEETTDGNLQVYHKIIAIFLEECPKRMANLQKAVDDVNRPAVELLAHAIKGAASTIGGERLQAAALALEQASLSAEPGELRRLMAPLLRECEQLQVALRSAARPVPPSTADRQ